MASPKLEAERAARPMASKCSAFDSVPSLRPIAGSELARLTPCHRANNSSVVTMTRAGSSRPGGNPACCSTADTRIPNCSNFTGRRPGTRKCLLMESGFAFERGHIDDKAVFDIGLLQAVIGFVDLLDGDDFDISGEVVFAAEVEHFLGFDGASDGRTGEAATAEDKVEGRHGQRFFRRAYKREVAVAAKKVEIRVDVVIGRDGV